MGRTIDADVLNAVFEMDGYKSPYIERMIDACPTLDCAPVRNSVWEEYENTIICKACGEKWSIREDGDYVIIEAKEDLKYCPTCGAKMDGKADAHDA